MRTDLERAIDALAAEQWGIWTGTQARRLGAGENFCSRRVLRGAYQRLHPDVFAHGSWLAPPEGVTLAAVYSLPDGVASCDSGAWLQGLQGAKLPRDPWVTVVRGGQRDRPLNIRTTTSLQAWRRTVVRRIPCMTVAGTLVDLTGMWDEDRLCDAWSHALDTKLTTIHRLQAVALPVISGRGAGYEVLQRLLDAHNDEEPPPQSTLERLLIELVEAGGYGGLVRQAPLPSFRDLRQRADAFLPGVRLILEADGRPWHVRVRDFVRDRRRDNEAQALGYAVARFTHLELTSDRELCVGVLNTHYRRHGYYRDASGLWLPVA